MAILPAAPPPRLPAASRCLLLVACLSMGACATRSGHFYQDDGPPDHPPPGLAQLPDAVPRIEPLNPRANRPYSALGRSYTPDTSDAPFDQRGMASWYGRQYHGNPTASGEPYDMYAMTAAHPTLPIPSYARVTRVSDGRSVVVRINDRGPFLQDRVIDLSYAAATRLGIVGPGSGEVNVHKITARDIAAGNVGGPAGANPAPAPVALVEPAAPAVKAEPALPAAAAAAVPAAVGSAVPAPVPAPVPAAATAAVPAAEPVLPAVPAPPAASATPAADAVPAPSPAAGVRPASAETVPDTTPPSDPGLPTEAAISTRVVASADDTPAPPSRAGAPSPATPIAAPPAVPVRPAVTAPTAPVAPPAVVPAQPRKPGAPEAPPAQAAVAKTMPPAAKAAEEKPSTAAASEPADPAFPSSEKAGSSSAKAKWSVQLGAFAVLANAQSLRDEMAALLARQEDGPLPSGGRQPRIEFDGHLHHVLVGEFDTRLAAQRSARALQRRLSRDTAVYPR